MNKIWKLGAKTSFSEVGPNTFVVSFANLADKQRVKVDVLGYLKVTFSSLNLFIATSNQRI